MHKVISIKEAMQIMIKRKIMITNRNIQLIINLSGSQKLIQILINPIIIIKTKITKVLFKKNSITKFKSRKRLCMLQK